MFQPSHPKTIKCLNDERSEILREIAEGDLKRSLDQLKARYNVLMDRIDIIDKSPLGDPLIALPLELWEKIIYDAIGSGFTSTIDILLPLTLVSTSWRQSILANPGFWSQIRISEQTEDLEAKVTTCIQLSGNFPLDLYVDVREPLWDVVCSTIVAQSPRIRTLVATAPPFLAQQDADLKLIDFFKSFGKLSALEDLSVYQTVDFHINLDFLLKDTTCIRSISGVYLSPQTLRLDSMQKIRSLYVNQSHYDILPHISDFLHLEDVSFLNSRTKIEDEEAAFSNSDKIEDVVNLNQELWQWETLSIAHHPGKLTFSLLDIVSSTLYHLNITTPWDLLSHLLTACIHMPRLTSLCITLPISTSAWFQSPLLNNQKSGLKYFTLFIERHYSLHHQNIDEAAKAACQNAAQGLANAFTAWAPNVKNIYIHSEINPFFALPYLQSLRHLNSLHVSKLNPACEAFPEARLDGIESLHLIAENKVPNLSNLSCPNITKLSIGLSAPDKQPFILQPLGVHAAQWINLRTIDIATDDVLWENISLPYVESITIGSRSPSIHPRHLSPSLLKEMACNPSVFPSLIYLGMRSFPDWDILFIMLEKRNLLTSMEIRAVKKLSLPSFPAPMVHRPLSKLLQRRMTDRPSNFDISLQSLAQAYFDRELGGCSYCHRSFVLCTQNYTYFPYPPGVDVKRDISKLRVPSYPSTDNEVLSTCLQRANWWEDTVRNLGERGQSCARHDTYNLVEITGYTGLGLSKALDLEHSASLVNMNP